MGALVLRDKCANGAESFSIVEGGSEFAFSSVVDNFFEDLERDMDRAIGGARNGIGSVSMIAEIVTAGPS